MDKKKRLPVGISDFKNIIEENYYFVDKSLFIKDVLNDDSKIILLPRPRRFGKTLNMTMLKAFVEKTDENNAYLFKNLKISKDKNFMLKQGQYPVIYLTFKDVKQDNWDDCFRKICSSVAYEYTQHRYLLKSDRIYNEDKLYIQKIINKECIKSELEESIKKLSEFLYLHHKVKPFVLIDEYDTPINKGYDSDYYEEIISFLRNFLSGGLKDNINLEKGVLTGIYRVAKESIFSGLNNPGVYTILRSEYNQFFGVTEAELDTITEFYGVENKRNIISKWYNGYNFGGEIIYNPWSIVNFLSSNDRFPRPYWIQTSENAIIRKLVLSEKIDKKNIEELITGNGIVKTLDEHVSFKDLDNKNESVWSFLTFSGYLNAVQINNDRRPKYKLTMPNQEVEIFFEDIFSVWLENTIGSKKLDYMLKALITGDIKTFEKILNEFVLSILSYYDTNKDEPEKVYHAFFLGMFLNLTDNYDIISNKESGYGRFDCMIIPKDITKKGFVIEIKKVEREFENEDFDKAVESALKQIKDKKYDQTLKDRGIKDITHIGIAVEKKKVKIKELKIKDT